MTRGSPVAIAGPLHLQFRSKTVFQSIHGWKTMLWMWTHCCTRWLTESIHAKLWIRRVDCIYWKESASDHVKWNDLEKTCTFNPTCGLRIHKEHSSFISHAIWAPPLGCTETHLLNLSPTHFEMNILALLSHAVSNKIKIHLRNCPIYVIITIFIKIKGYWILQQVGSTK